VDLAPISLLTRLCIGASAAVALPSGTPGSSEPRARFGRASCRCLVRKAAALTTTPCWCPSRSLTGAGDATGRGRNCRRAHSRSTLSCPGCGGRLRLVAIMTEPKEIPRFLRAVGEPTEARARSPARGPPFWRSRMLRPARRRMRRAGRPALYTNAAADTPERRAENEMCQDHRCRTARTISGRSRHDSELRYPSHVADSPDGKAEDCAAGHGARAPWQ
jgi:hypothetical protein